MFTLIIRVYLTVIITYVRFCLNAANLWMFDRYLMSGYMLSWHRVINLVTVTY